MQSPLKKTPNLYLKAGTVSDLGPELDHWDQWQWEELLQEIHQQSADFHHS